jgi:hypothetical protein
MSSNMLKLNQDKTELIAFALKHHVKEFSECCLSFDGTIVTNASFVKNLGFNATFNNISVLSCRSVLLVEETGVPGENHRPVASH